jgi:hypothetical protein
MVRNQGVIGAGLDASRGTGVVVMLLCFALSLQPNQQAVKCFGADVSALAEF